MSVKPNSSSIEPATRYELVEDICTKAIQACALCYITSKISYRAGLVYGGLAGIVQLVFSAVHNKIDEKTTSDNAKTLNYLISISLPWIVSGIALGKIYKNSGNENIRMSFGMCKIIALMQQVLGRSNIHLLPKGNF